MARPKRFELLTPRFVAWFEPLISLWALLGPAIFRHSFHGNRREVLRPFRPVSDKNCAGITRSAESRIVIARFSATEARRRLPDAK